jgi:hypothetical protein
VIGKNKLYLPYILIYPPCVFVKKSNFNSFHRQNFVFFLVSLNLLHKAIQKGEREGKAKGKYIPVLKTYGGVEV